MVKKHNVYFSVAEPLGAAIFGSEPRAGAACLKAAPAASFRQSKKPCTSIKHEFQPFIEIKQRFYKF